MATRFSRTLEMGQEEIFDYECTRCKTINRTMEAFHFCTDCEDLFCDTCRETHASFTGLKDHKVLGRDKVKQWIQMKKNTSVFSKKCPRHEGEVLQVFCGDHDTLCCHVCVALYHSKCNDKNYIPKMAKGICQSEKIQIIDQEFADVKFHLDKIKHNREQNKAKLEKSRNQVLQQLRDIRKQVNKTFDILEKSATAEMENRYSDKNEGIIGDIGTCERYLAELEDLKHQLEAAKQDNNEYETFVNLKQSQQKVAEADQTINNMLMNPRSDTFKFSIEPKLKELLANIRNLGEIDIMETFLKDTSPSIQPYSADSKHNCNVKMQGDINDCNINGSCQLPDGTILLTDSNNNKIKRLDASYNVIDDCDITSCPTSVCCISQQEAAVTDDNNTIHFVSVGRNKMTVSGSVKMKHKCWRIAYNNRRLYISDIDNIYIHNKYGSCLYHTLDLEKTSAAIYTINDFAISKDGTKIYVTNNYQGLLTLNTMGHRLSRFGNLDHAGRICVDQQGCVFVCEIPTYRRSNLKYAVYQLDETGTHILGKVKQSARRPQSILLNMLKLYPGFNVPTQLFPHTILVNARQPVMTITHQNSNKFTVHHLKSN